MESVDPATVRAVSVREKRIASFARFVFGRGKQQELPRSLRCAPREAIRGAESDSPTAKCQVGSERAACEKLGERRLASLAGRLGRPDTLARKGDFASQLG
jgi:hypothetical protein